jgi:hypothetical protein
MEDTWSGVNLPVEIIPKGITWCYNNFINKMPFAGAIII